MRNEEIFRLIRSGPKGRDQVARYLCSHEKLKNGIKKVMSKMRVGTEEDFWEIFDMTIMKFFKRVMTDDKFTIEKNLHSYLFVIANHSWIHELEQRNQLPGELPGDYELTPDGAESTLALMENKELGKILGKILDQIGDLCKAVLMMWAEGIKMKEIQGKLNLNTEGAARKKKHDCLKKLLVFLDDNPGSKALLR